MDLLSELDRCPVLADGAMGTELLAAGIPAEHCLEEVCASQPALVARIHDAYIAAGARVIRTNSFGGNAARLARHGLDHHVGEFNWTAAQIARASAKGHDVLVAGSVGPIGPGVDHARLFSDQMGALLDGGAQFILLETFQSLAELLVAVEIKHTLHHCPVVCNLTCDDSGKLPDGTTLADAFTQLRAADADVLGVNCTRDPRTFAAIFDHLPDSMPRSAFPSAGLPPHDFLPEDFATLGAGLVARGVRLVGGCCGTTPAHIAALHARLVPPHVAG